MTADVPPKKPNNPDLSKYLRFIDPSDPTKVMQLGLVDTGVTAPDGSKIFSLSTNIVGSGGGSAVAVLLDKIRHVFAGTTTIKDLYSIKREDLTVTESECEIHAAVPVTVVGAGNKQFIASGTIGFPGVSSYIFGATYVGNAKRVTGVLLHDFTNAEPGLLKLVMSGDPAFTEIGSPNSTMIFVVLNDLNKMSLAEPDNRVTFSLERTDNYFRIEIYNPNATAHSGKVSASRGI